MPNIGLRGWLGRSGQVGALPDLSLVSIVESGEG